MPPNYQYRESVLGTYTDVTSYFRLYLLDVTMQAEEGAVGSSQLTADDPSATADFVGHRQFNITEDTATGSNTRIFTGYVADREVHRGDSGLTGASRVWDISLVDMNAVLERRIFDLTSASRPAETDIARLTWLMTTEEAAFIHDSRYLNTSNAVQMDAVDYRGQTVRDVIDDCAQDSGKNWFMWYAEDSDAFSLWYDFSSSTSYRSPIRLSNVLTDIDNVWTFAISDDTKLKRDPSRVFSGVYLPFDGGAVYDDDIDTANAFARRDVAMPSVNVKTSARAHRRALRYLSDLNEEEDLISTAVILPAAKVNFLKAGMAVQVKGSHLPGYESFNWGRVISCNVTQLSEEYYRLALDIDMTGPSVSNGGTQDNIGSGGGGSNVLGTLLTDIAVGTNGNNSEAEYGDDGTGPGTLYLYEDCVYAFSITVAHAHTSPAIHSNYLKVQVDNGVPVTSMGAERLGTAVTSFNYVTPSPGPTHTVRKARLVLAHTAYVNCNGIGSNAACTVSYVSGPDPRFP